MRRVFNHSRGWALVPLLILGISGISTARADAVAIRNGDTKTGTITGNNTDSYTFRADGSTTYFVSLAETGTHDETFLPMLEMYPPSGDPHGSAHALNTALFEANAAQGDWTITVSRFKGAGTGGSYDLKLIQVPGTTGTALTASPVSSTIKRDEIDVYTFTGTAGNTINLTISRTGGDGFMPEATLFSPSGAGFSGFSCANTCIHAITLTDSGSYTLLVRKSDYEDVTGTYTVSVTGNQGG